MSLTRAKGRPCKKEQEQGNRSRQLVSCPCYLPPAPIICFLLLACST